MGVSPTQKFSLSARRACVEYIHTPRGGREGALQVLLSMQREIYLASKKRPAGAAEEGRTNYFISLLEYSLSSRGEHERCSPQ